MLLHDVQEPIALLGQRRSPLLCAAGELLEEIGDNVVQAGTAACANHGVYKDRKKGQRGMTPASDRAQNAYSPTTPNRSLARKGQPPSETSKVCWGGGQLL